ncbi:MAG: phosphomannomutase [Rickettsiales bacterium]|nr:phosphomannomutase [Rickettsiales bacterium]OUW05490.1 MAG: hypothetical protein CBD16_00915 [Betaproteobacteria bacterium TMED156]
MDIKVNEINHTIFREYDIRGIINKTLKYSDAFLIGRAFASKIFNSQGITVAVGRDGRLTSKMLSTHLIKGLNKSGANVIDIGCGPTPMLYFAREFLNSDAAIMVTGSHNPPDHNGFKIMIGSNSFFGKKLLDLKKIILEGMFYNGKGKTTIKSVFEDYKKALIEKSYEIKPFNVIWDCGNGSSGELITQLVKELPGQHKVIFGEIDGNFPNHHPDPTEPKNLESLIKEVKKTNSDLGIAFDGDGDRIGVVTKRGVIVPGDIVTAFLAGGIIKKNRRAPIILDIKSSDSAFDSIKKQSGNPIFWKTGHSLIKEKLKKSGSLLAGEMSGHIFIRDNWYGFDDAPYSALRLLHECGRRNYDLEKFYEETNISFSSPEIRIDCKEILKFKIVNKIKEKIKKINMYSIIDIDGIRAKNKHGWWLIRPSNTQSCIIARAEGKSKNDLNVLIKEIEKFLKEENFYWNCKPYLI